jgi:DNA-directed RNA polymerase subunit omega
MARITVEDCIERIPNRFELIRATVLRTRQLKRGARRIVESENREVVTALREIAAGYVVPVYPDAEELAAIEAAGAAPGAS